MNQDANKTPGLPCFVCGKSQQRVVASAEPAQCDDATIFKAEGNYGSTLFDPNPMGTHRQYQYLAVSVCDPCLNDRRDRVLIYTVVPQPAVVTGTPWTAVSLEKED